MKSPWATHQHKNRCALGRLRIRWLLRVAVFWEESERVKNGSSLVQDYVMLEIVSESSSCIVILVPILATDNLQLGTDLLLLRTPNFRPEPRPYNSFKWRTNVDREPVITNGPGYNEEFLEINWLD